MSAHGVGLRAFALRAGLDKSAVWRLLHGQTHRCTIEIADKLFAATNGEIGFKDVRAFEDRVRRRRERAA
jgi:hypothetical protein